jgi:hypothetical protein
VLINSNQKQEAVKPGSVPRNYQERDLNNITSQEAGFSLDEQLADIDRFLDNV